jgi:hypothetical protein
MLLLDTKELTTRDISTLQERLATFILDEAIHGRGVLIIMYGF